VRRLVLRATAPPRRRTRAHSRRNRLSFRLAAALDEVAPEGFEVLEAITVRVGPDRILIPDTAVVTDPGTDGVVSDAAGVALVVEIVSPGSVVADRAIKPRLHADAGIATTCASSTAPRGRPRSRTGCGRAATSGSPRAATGERLRLTEPFAVDVDLAELAARTRPAG
jgi:hypothetical protein